MQLSASFEACSAPHTPILGQILTHRVCHTQVSRTKTRKAALNAAKGYEVQWQASKRANECDIG